MVVSATGGERTGGERRSKRGKRKKPSRIGLQASLRRFPCVSTHSLTSIKSMTLVDNSSKASTRAISMLTSRGARRTEAKRTKLTQVYPRSRCRIASKHVCTRSQEPSTTHHEAAREEVGWSIRVEQGRSVGGWV